MEKSKSFKIVWWSPKKVKPYEKNPRRITQQAIDKVAASLERFGWRQPIVVDKDGVIVVGHTRWLAAMALGYDKVPVHVASDLSPAEARAYRIADNRTGEESEWDFDLLTEELSGLGDLDFSLDDIGFTDAELADILSGDEVLGPNTEWEGMPEYVSEDKTAFRSIIVHFKDAEAVEKFVDIIGAKVTEATKMLWYPAIEIERATDKRYDSAS